jgi:hypothetical protein
LFGYNLESAPAWNDNLYLNYLVPEMSRLLEGKDYQTAIVLSHMTEFCSYQQPHTKERAQECYRMTSQAFRDAAERFAGEIARSQPASANTFPKQELPVIAFLSEYPVMNGVLAGAMLNILMGESRRRTFVPIICALGGIFGINIDRLASLGIGVIDLQALRGDARGDDFVGRMVTLRQLLEQHKVTALVYYNVSDAFSNFLSALQFSPVQIYLSMGFHHNEARYFDGLITRGAAGQTVKTVDGVKWRTYEWIRQQHFDPAPLVAAGKALRATKFSACGTILGSICRPAKIDNDEFMDALAEIMHTHDDAVFLWFGVEELPTVRQRMEARKIASRCLFAGWVHVQEYAQVLDIHLDAFPFPCGATMVDTMCYGVPYVFMDCEEARQTGLLMDIKPLIEGQAGSLSKVQMRRIRQIFTEPVTGESLVPIAANPEEYVALASRLISDLAYRSAVGKAAQQFIAEFKTDLDVGTRTFFNQCREIIAKKRSALAQKR